MASAPNSSLHMRSTDLIIKEPLDYGGFGEVYLCYHVTLGHVVLKTMYTGPLRNEDSKRSLLEEGSIMASLNHERVVKLLGVIMEDRDCSLVMELIPRGNLLVMLETVNVPLSVKGRIILEILEGMIYLTERRVIHKDIKPENILVDKDFHIKIADLGLATCQTWNKLTKQESRRKSRGRSAGIRGAGTLSYMAPEHLDSIHTASTEKSDVYSFAIVLWVILTAQEPYANARSEDHISQCVRNGDRPAEDQVPGDTPLEMIDLMKRCWHVDPQQRPTFKECYDYFLPFFKEKLESQIEEDLLHLREIYRGPDELVDKMKSLSVANGSFAAGGHDSPAPLLSSDRSLSAPVEASIEDMHHIQNEQHEGCIQTDARRDGELSDLEEKLHRELEYHKNGNYNCESQPECDRRVHTSHSSPSMPAYLRASEQILRQPEQERSTVQSWTKAEPVQPTGPEEAMYHPSAATYESLKSVSPSPLSRSVSTPSVSPLNQQHPHSHLDRSYSVSPVSDTSAPDNTQGRLFTPAKCGSSQDQGSFYIQNVSGIQIGSYNTMSIRGYEPSLSSLSVPANDSANSPIKEGIRKYEDHPVTEAHLDLLRDNIGNKWKRCARRLGLTSVEIETIEHDYFLDGLPEMVHQMLERWKMKEGSIGCTIGKLYRAIDGNIKVDVIQKILENCASSSSLS